MEHRRPRLGGIVDDYCPRERRITDHAVVAMVEEEIKQTRCTTCDEEHPYKQAKLPTLRKKKSSLYEQVLSGRGEPNGGRMAGRTAGSPAARGNGAATPGPAADPDPDADAVDEIPPEAAASAGVMASDEVRVHRRLIRATLPRPEGQVQARPLPEFTIRQSASPQHRDADPRRPAREPANGNSIDQPPGSRRASGSRNRRPGRGNGHGGQGNQAERGQGRPRSRSRRSRAGKKRSK